MTAVRTLSKSDFILARSCDAKLYFRENGYPDNRESDPYLRLLAEGGYMVEALACARYADGIKLEYGGDHAADCAETLAHLAQQRITLFQGTLLWGRRLARVDILEKHGDRVRLIEVKAKSFDGAEHLSLLQSGKPGVFREKRKPHDVLTYWREKLADVTYQVLLLERLLPGVTIHPFLCLVDKSKRSTLDELPRLFEIDRRPGRDGRERLHDARYLGDAGQLAGLDLLTEVDVSTEVALLRAEVEESAARFEALLDAPFNPSLAVRGAKCAKCEYRLDDPTATSGFDHCWGELAHVEPHVLELHSIGTVMAAGRPLVEALVESGRASLFDIAEEHLAKKDGSIGPRAERQRRQIRYARTGETWIGPDLKPKIEALDYPLYFIDFEVSRLALPYHAGMRPYGQVVFQWSCHAVAEPGAVPVHREWLNTTDIWPNRAFVVALREAIGHAGTVLTWTSFEWSRLNEILRELPQFGITDPELVAWISQVATRITDLHEWARDDFYHPAMRGRTSIKIVLDALWKADPVMRRQFADWTGLLASEAEDPYHALPALEINGVPQDVREGTGAMRAYQAMMYGVEKGDTAAKESWCALLRQYCKLDTLSMVLIFEHWRRATGLAKTRVR